MFQPKKPPPTTNIRLPKLPGQPGFDDIHFLLIEAQRSRGRTVEMPWNNEDRTWQYMLSARCEQGGGEPAWILYKGQSEANRLTWSYASGDVSLIYNLVLSEISGGVQENTAANAYVSVSNKPAQGPTQALPALDAQSGSGGFPSITKGKQKAILEGDLTNMQPPNLLQSIAISKMTGRLLVETATDNAEVYFDDGAPTHAQTRESTGDMAIIELLTWEKGDFEFFPDERTTTKSVKKRLDTILMEGVSLLDQVRFISSHGVKLESYLQRRHQTMSEADFEKAVSSGAPIDLMMQKQFYQCIDNKSTLFELLRKRPMSKLEWVAVMFNLIHCGLVSVSEQAPRQAAPLEAMGVDRSAILGVHKSLSRTESGILTYPALLYFLENEWFRYEATRLPFSVLIFEARTKASPDAPAEPLTMVGMRELAKRVNSVKRNLDILAHWETFDYAMLLPNTDLAAAQVFANRLVEMLYSSPLSPDLANSRLVMGMGVASIPEDCSDLGMMLSAAYQAKNQAKQGNSPVLLYKNLRG